MGAINRCSKAKQNACLLVAMLGIFFAGCDEEFDGPPDIVPAQFAALASPLGASSGGSAGPPRLVPIADGDTVELVQPVQGGFVLFVGAFGQNLSMRSASLLGELRRSTASDGSSLAQPGGVLYSDERSVSIQPLPEEALLSSGGSALDLGPAAGKSPHDQQVVPELANLANIPACPNPLDVDVVDNPLFLVLRYRDAKGRSTSATRKVVPRCVQANPDERRSCICQCLAHYTTARCYNPPDGG